MTDAESMAKDERRAYRIFLVSLTLILSLLIAGIFLGIAIRNSMLVKDIILERGRSMFQQIVLTRRWAAGYGGVYVRKGPGVESNPWLIHPDLEAADGSMLTLRNPALMTREISEIAAREEGYRFKITSLQPLNPSNAPDGFERRSLESFDAGATESWETTDDAAGRQFRYMGALKTEDSCLACHASQGYKVGDIRGGISVRFEVSDVERELTRNMAFIVVSALAVTAITLALVFAFVMKLRRELDRVRAELARAATTDTLTGLFNRRYLMERLAQETDKAVRTGANLSCAIIDADDFKSVNDADGHVTGDLALVAIATAMLAEARSYDAVARYGGEEFLIAFPGTDALAALRACDRIRLAVAEKTAAALPRGRAVTISVGIADLDTARAARPAGAKGAHGGTERAAVIEAVLRNADVALYRAKAAGKNRCVVFGAES